MLREWYCLYRGLTKQHWVSSERHSIKILHRDITSWLGAVFELKADLPTSSNRCGQNNCFTVNLGVWFDHGLYSLIVSSSKTSIILLGYYRNAMCYQCVAPSVWTSNQISIKGDRKTPTGEKRDYHGSPNVLLLGKKICTQKVMYRNKNWQTLIAAMLLDGFIFPIYSQRTSHAAESILDIFDSVLKLSFTLLMIFLIDSFLIFSDLK